eukprot:4201631-Pleurochrysis_carterae.AAC.1
MIKSDRTLRSLCRRTVSFVSFMHHGEASSRRRISDPCPSSSSFEVVVVHVRYVDANKCRRSRRHRFR